MEHGPRGESTMASDWAMTPVTPGQTFPSSVPIVGGERKRHDRHDIGPQPGRNVDQVDAEV